LGFISLVSASESTGFQSGSRFFVEKVSGDLVVNCQEQYSPPFNGGPFFGSARCTGFIMNPTDFDYFVGPNVDADHVSLWAEYEDGTKSKEKTEKYLPGVPENGSGRSKGAFNLGTRTLFQKPLLSFGRNIIHYALTKKKAVIQSGEFVVNVIDGGSRQCPRYGRYYSPDSSGCSFPERYCSNLLKDPRYCY
jgi:hypothetical protein